MASSLTIMNRLIQTFSTDGDVPAAGQLEKPNYLTRYFGGHNRNNHPFVNGYWQLWLSPPTRIFNSSIHSQAIEWFHATCEGFTPPSRNLNKADIPGQGGLGSSYVTGQTLNRTFSITFREYRDMPLMQLFELWTSVIDPYVGVSEVNGSDWKAKVYKGSAFVVFTKPVGAYEANEIRKQDIEEVYYFHGVWPENPPHDAMATDISANDVVQYSINFSFDGFPLTKVDPNVVSQAQSLLSGWQYLKHTYQPYVADVTSRTAF